MFRAFGILFGFAVIVYAKILMPVGEIEAGGNVIDLVVKDGKIIVATDSGSLEIYNQKSLKLEKRVAFEPIKDFMDNPINPKLFSVDKVDAKEIYLALLQSPTSYRRLAVVKDGKVEYLIQEDDRLMIKKAKFVTEDKVLLGLLSNEIILFDIHAKKSIYRFQLSQSHFSDFVLNEDKTFFAATDESGKVYLVDTFRGNVLKTYAGGNVDNVYKLDMKKDRIITAGQDRRGIVYDRSSKDFDRYDASFLIYACALSPSSKIAAWAFNEKNDIILFNLDTKTKIHTLRGQKSTLNSIVFVNEKELFSASDDKFIMQWRLP